MVRRCKCVRVPRCKEANALAPVSLTREEILNDVAPVLDVLKIETCTKNQEVGGEDGAWCVYARLKRDSRTEL